MPRKGSVPTLIIFIGFCILYSKSKPSNKTPPNDFKKQPIERATNLEPEFMSEKINVEEDRPVVNYNSCYTAPLEEHILKKNTGHVLGRSYCSTEKYHDLLENSYLNNPKVECLPGFEEADVYFNIVTKSSLLTKYGDYWCTVGRVCCK